MPEDKGVEECEESRLPISVARGHHWHGSPLVEHVVQCDGGLVEATVTDDQSATPPCVTTSACQLFM